jgi:hypothetical protein
MKRGGSDVVAAACWRRGTRRVRRRGLPIGLLVGAVMGISLGYVPGAVASSTSRAWLAHSPLHASTPRSASRSLPGRRLRSPISNTIEGRRSGIRRETAHPAAADGGQISGSVTSAATTGSIEGIEVCAFEYELPFAETCATTSANGEYTLTRLEAGEYVVGFFVPFESQLNYITQFYEEASTFAEAKVISVVAGRTTKGIDATLNAGGEITGKVTSEASKAAVGGILVCVYEEELEYERCATTDSDGEYAVLGLATGNYEVQFSEPFEGNRNYATQYYDDEESPSEADLVPVTAKATTSGINASLSAGGGITGDVTSFSSHAPLNGIEVCAFQLTVFTPRCTTTDSNGAYDLKSLSSGEYIVEFYSIGDEYSTQYYDQVTSFEDAKKVSVDLGKLTEGIDAELKLEPPSDITPPTISGSAVEGQVLTAVHGSWSNTPIGYADEWGLCDSAGDLNTCRTIETGETLTLTASDVGHAIRLRETASNEGGRGAAAYSAPTAAVAEASPPQTPPPGPPSGGVQGSSGVLGTTTAVASAAQIKALLLSVLAPTGKNAKIEALLAHGGYSVSFGALLAGQLVVSWYLVPRGAHLAAARPTLVARGHVSFTAAGKAKIVVKLTASGRSLLRHKKELQLTAQGSLTPNAQGAVSATKAFVVRR